MKCLETRRRDGMKWRRYRTEDGRTITTYELPTTVVRAVGVAKVTQALEKWQRGEDSRARIARIKKLVAQGIKPTAIAYEEGVTDQRVRQIRKQMLENPK